MKNRNFALSLIVFGCFLSLVGMVFIKVISILAMAGLVILATAFVWFGIFIMPAKPDQNELAGKRASAVSANPH